jgi:galactoside O-acetyltransferase|tara:strand:- start:18 stop:758 length:741 start_codon:yes stop_codon:yes gene_type:complete
MSEKMNKTHKAITENGSALKKYQNIILGTNSIFFLFYFEFCSWISKIPGALGIILRKIFWPSLFASCGKGVFFADNITLRHTRRIHLGNNIVISENCVLDARHDNKSDVIILDDDVILSVNVMISCKNGSVKIGNRTGISTQTVIHSTNNCPVSIGSDVIIGAQSYLVGGGIYNFSDPLTPIKDQGIKNDGGIKIQNNVWLGAKVVVLGGTTIESGSIIGASAVVTKNIPANSICTGIPATVKKIR